ncbi:unnamed protein product [Rhizoctonia solani]|uniref:Uncharacterized protein n=1 Tax=Rhizoctonia solani TaxID=456999 RepID=A0A8H3CUF2_9AGAM|nr:unnamed protein product [Rhizoctonia solani]
MDGDRGKAPGLPSETSGQGGGGDAIHDLGMKMVDRGTHKIVQLLQIFEEQHGMMFFPRNMVYIIYECGVVLLREAVDAPLAAIKKRATALEAGHVCLRALRGASRTWPCAERLAGLLESKLNEVGADTTIQAFTSNWNVTEGGNEQAGTDLSQTFYQFVHVWDPAGDESSARSNPTSSVPGVKSIRSGSEMQASPSGTRIPSPLGLGLQILPAQHQSLDGPAIGSNAGGAGSAHVDEVARAYDVTSFSGIPSSSSAPSYSLPRREEDDRMWDSPL